MLDQLKKLLPARTLIQFRGLWHGLRGYFTAFSLLLPAKKLKIIAITGTKGKTTTTVFVGRLLNSIGIKTGFVSTALVYLGTGEEHQNPFKMTTIDPVLLQRYLKSMEYVGCKVAVLEMSSQGLESNRHWGVFGFDVGVFLNLYPEHLDAHGSMENYRAAKGILFENMRKNSTVITNAESEDSAYMLSRVPESIQLTAKKVDVFPSKEIDSELLRDKYSLALVHEGSSYVTQYFSAIEVLDFYYSCIIAKEAAEQLGQEVELSSLLNKSSETGHVPGRMEFAAHSSFADAMVDYAHEPESMKQLLKMCEAWRERGLYSNIIHLVSCDGVGRDDWKKEELGEISYTYADFSYLTTDNYGPEDDPKSLVELLAKKLPHKDLGKKYFQVTDRYEAMLHSLSKAKLLKGRTLIVSTGVGNEFGLTRPEGKIEWNEVKQWKKVFKSLGKER